MKKKILIIIWSFTAGGGAEKILANLANYLDPEKYEIDIVEYENFDYKKEVVSSNINLLNPININRNSKRIKRKYLEIYFKVKGKVNKILLFLFPQVLRKKTLKSKKYDIEIGFNYLIPSFFISSSSKAKKVVWIHSSIEDLDYRINKSIRTYVSFLKQKNAFKKIDKIVTISNKTMQSVLHLYPECESKLIKIYNGYDFCEIKKKSEQKINIKKKSFTILAAGRLVEQKNFSLLVEVAQILRDRTVDFEIILLGEGDERIKLEKLIKQKNLKSVITMTGYRENPYPFFKVADLFCMTSIVEGFPTVLIESMFLGCPFVSTPVAGTEELSNNGKCGKIVDYNSIHIANEIEYLINNPTKLNEMKQYCISFAQKYTIEEQIIQVEKLLDKL